jgi:hypothetical protein
VRILELRFKESLKTGARAGGTGSNPTKACQGLLKKRKKKAFRKRPRNPPKLIETPAKFEHKEEAQPSVTVPPSAVQTTPPLTLENGTKEKWSAQWVKVSVKALSSDD